MKLSLIHRCGSFLSQFSVLLVLVHSAAFGQAGAGGRNGGGLGEMRFQLAFDQAFQLFHYCANEGRCHLNEEESRWVGALLRIEGLERRSARHFEFQANQSETFRIDGQVRIARTGLAPGDLIYVNLDLVYRKNPLGETEAVTYLEAMTAVVHELGHHVGSLDHTALDAFGAKIAALAKRFGYLGSLGLGAEYIQFLAVNPGDAYTKIEILPKPVQSLGAILIEDATSGYDVSKWVLDPILKHEQLCLVYVDDTRTKCKTFLGPEHVIQSVSFYNLHWSEFVTKPIFRPEPSTILLHGTAAISGWVDRVPGTGFVAVSGFYEFTLEVKVREKRPNLLMILEDSIRLRSIRLDKGGLSYIR